MSTYMGSPFLKPCGRHDESTPISLVVATAHEEQDNAYIAGFGLGDSGRRQRCLQRARLYDCERGDLLRVMTRAAFRGLRPSRAAHEPSESVVKPFDNEISKSLLTVIKPFDNFVRGQLRC